MCGGCRLHSHQVQPVPPEFGWDQIISKARIDVDIDAMSMGPRGLEDALHRGEARAHPAKSRKDPGAENLLTLFDFYRRWHSCCAHEQKHGRSSVPSRRRHGFGSRASPALPAWRPSRASNSRPQGNLLHLQVQKARGQLVTTLEPGSEIRNLLVTFGPRHVADCFKSEQASVAVALVTVNLGNDKQKCSRCVIPRSKIASPRCHSCRSDVR